MKGQDAGVGERKIELTGLFLFLGAAKPSLFFNQNIPKLALAARLPAQQYR